MRPIHTLVRHAESAANAGLPSTDPAAIPLTPAGRRAAEEFATVYPGPEPALIVVSPFVRAKQTAVPFTARFPDVPAEEWPIQEFTYLAPRRCGNSTAAQRKPLVDAYWKSAGPDHVDGPGAESFATFLARVSQALTRLDSSPGPVVVFTHEMVMKAALWLESVGGGVVESPAAFRTFSLTFSIPNLGTLNWPPNSIP